MTTRERQAAESTVPRPLPVERGQGSPRKGRISDSLVKSVCRRLRRNLRVRRTLPGNGRLHIDRQLPFLCVYRRPAEH